MVAVTRRSKLLAGGLLGLLLALPATTEAQRGSITYTRSMKLDIELPPEMRSFVRDLPSDISHEVLLRFDETASLTIARRDPGFGGRRGARARRGANRRVEIVESPLGPGELAAALSAAQAFVGGDIGAMRGAAAETYIRFADGIMVEAHDFLGRQFRVRRERPDLEWRLTGEQAEHDGYMVLQATTEHDGTQVEAWFTPEIPLPGGPDVYGGLPGMILVVSLDGGESKFFATEIALDEEESEPIAEPTEGDEMTPEEFDQMVEEKLEEFRSMAGMRRRGPARVR
ncbi:MAG: GLPGLI family protein [Gemmatimonadetes bacterium]|nr:GLPGLI family protein [Gemmatimonadota bacterium]